MSRSMRACVKSCALVTVVAYSAEERAKLEDGVSLGRGPLAGAISSTKRLIGLVTASMLVLATVPAVDLAASASGSDRGPSVHHSKQSPIHAAHIDAAL